ncbi:MAG: hypothetical protein ACTIJ6_08660 [Leucobacter sp.]
MERMYEERHPDSPVLERALARGARLVTKPTDFFGTQFARVQDASVNLGWIWQHGEAAWDAHDDGNEWPSDGDNAGWGEVSPGLEYIHDTLLEAMTALRDPKGS